MTSISSKHDVEEIHSSLCSILKYAIPHMSNLTHLNLSRTRFTDNMVGNLCEILCVSEQVKELDLTCIGISSEGLRQLADEYLSTGPR